MNKAGYSIGHQVAGDTFLGFPVNYTALVWPHAPAPILFGPTPTQVSGLIKVGDCTPFDFWPEAEGDTRTYMLQQGHFETGIEVEFKRQSDGRWLRTK